jgi:DNA-binding MarR family transcriptional regulator
MDASLTDGAALAIEILEERWAIVSPRNLPYHILLLGKLIDRVTAQHVRTLADLSLAEWRAMAHIDYLKVCSAREIANLAFVDPAEVSRAVRSLEERGLVRREVNPKNRKASIVSLTKEGKVVHKKIRGERGQYFEDWVTDLSETDREELYVMLRNIIRRIVTKAPQTIDS